VSAGQSLSRPINFLLACVSFFDGCVCELCFVLPRFFLKIIFLFPFDGCAVRWFIWNSVGATESQVPAGGGTKLTKNRDKEKKY
jgi:hypothetical protein